MVRKEKKIASAIFLFVMIYLFLRAIYVPLVHDEAATFFHYIHTGNFLPPYAHWDANNHILNSLLSYLSSLLFGSSEIALRLPNVLFFSFFFYFTYKIAGELKNNYLRWTFILTLCFAHNFIEFFALTRGYGMSMAFLFGMIFYTIRVMQTNRLIYYLASALFLLLSIFSNLTLILSAFIIAFILFINVFYHSKHHSRSYNLKALTILCLGAIIPISLGIVLLLKFKEKGRLYYGNLDGFWDLTIRSISKLLSSSENLLFPLLAVFIFLISLLLIFYKIIKTKKLKSFYNINHLFPILLIGNLLAVLILAKVFGINYPEDRTGIYFFPLLIGTFLFALDQSDLTKKQLFPVILIPFLFFPIHFLNSMNLTHSSLWSSEHIPSSFFQKVEESSNESGTVLSVGGYHMRTLCWAYYNFRSGGNLNQIQSSHYPETLSDYQIADEKVLENYQSNYSVEAMDPISGLSLLKRNTPILSHQILEINKTSSGEINSKYFSFYKGEVDSLLSETLLIKLTMNVSSDRKPLKAWVVAQVNDEENQKVAYESISLDWKKTNWIGESKNFSASLFLYDLPKESKNISIYFWNMDGAQFILSDIHCSISNVLIE